MTNFYKKNIINNMDDQKISIDLHGMRAQEAIEAINDHIINCVNLSYSQVRIVHGHGTGVLKKITEEVLDSSVYVIKYYPDHNFSSTIGDLKY